MRDLLMRALMRAELSNETTDSICFRRVLYSSLMKCLRVGTYLCTVAIVAGAGFELSAAQGRGQASPAAQPPPQSTGPQQYPREQIETGRGRFASQCGFCH